MQSLIARVRWYKLFTFDYLEFTLPDPARWRLPIFFALSLPIFLKREIDNCLRKGLSKRWFIKIDGKIVGIFVTCTFSDVLNLSRFAIVPAYRGRGIGTDALTRLEKWAKRAGIKRLELAVSKNNLRALKLYIRLGYARHLEGSTYFILAKEPPR